MWMNRTLFLCFNPLYTNGFFLLVLYNKLCMIHCIYLGVSGYILFLNICIFCLNIFLTLTNSVDSDEMQHYAAFHLCLHFCKSTHLGVSQIQRVNFLFEKLLSCRLEWILISWFPKGYMSLFVSMLTSKSPIFQSCRGQFPVILG